jgi:hypothetical protein
VVKRLLRSPRLSLPQLKVQRKCQGRSSWFAILVLFPLPSQPCSSTHALIFIHNTPLFDSAAHYLRS